MSLYKLYFDELFRVEGEPLKACSTSKDHLLNSLLGEGWPVDRRTLCFTEHLSSLGSGVRIAWVQIDQLYLLCTAKQHERLKFESLTFCTDFPCLGMSTLTKTL